MMKKVLIAILLMGLITGGYVYFFMLNKSHPDYELLEAELNMAASELFKDSQSGNALKYTGKILEVYGTPTKLEKTENQVVLVYEFEEGMFGPEGIRASFLPQYHQDLSQLDFQSPILIKAYCTGYNDTDVILEKASIVSTKN
jgi:hypothetical protein